jgi:Domain of unknown function (DUF4382)
MEIRMMRKVLGASLALGLLAVITGGCGGSNTTVAAPPGQGSLFTVIKDAPSCDVLGYQIQVPQMQLRLQGSNSSSFFTAFSTSIGAFVSPNLDLVYRRDFTTILDLASVREGTYDQANIAVTATGASIFDPTQTPPVSTFPLTQNGNLVTVKIVPPLVITKGKIAVLKLDYDLAKSLQADARGQLTGEVNTSLGATPLQPSNNSYGEMDDVEGFVRSVTTNSTGVGFTGGFLLQMLSGTGPALTVNLTSSTQLLGVPSLDELITATFVEVRGHLDSSGNFVADIVRAEDTEDLSKNQIAYLGPVLSVTRDASGNIRTFEMMVRQTEPDDSFSVPINQGVEVMVSTTTTYDVTFPSMNFASLSFGPATVAPGQELAVHGIFTKATGQPISVDADSIYLRPQTLVGNFSSLIGSGSDDRTGAFQFTPCGGVFQQVPTMVITNNLTNFVNVSGLTGLTPLPTLLVKGVAFYQPQTATISGVHVPAGTLVVLATQVDQP